MAVWSEQTLARVGMRSHASGLTQVFHSPAASCVDFSTPPPFRSLLISYGLPD